MTISYTIAMNYEILKVLHCYMSKISNHNKKGIDIDG